MPRWIGLLGSWALFVLGLGLASIAAAGEYINVREARRFQRLNKIEQMIEAKLAGELDQLKREMGETAENVNTLQTQVTTAEKTAEDLHDSDLTIAVSTTENKVYVRQNKKLLFEAVCSTGKGTTLIHNGRTMVFNTPIGKFRIVSKEKDPVWVPPDWHYVEEARKSGMEAVRLERGESIDASTGGAATSRESGVWSWLGSSSGTSRVIKVKGNTVVEIDNGVERELPPGKMIVAGGKVIIPPLGTPQRKFDKVLGSYRLNLGDGYALHGTQMLSQLGQSVSHGCVRLADADIERLYSMTKVGDEVLIY